MVDVRIVSRAPQGRQLVIGNRRGLQDRHAGQGANGGGGLGHQAAVAPDRLVRPSKDGQGGDQVEGGLHGVGPERERAGIGRGGLRPKPKGLADIAQIMLRGEQAGLAANDAFQPLERAGQAAKADVDARKRIGRPEIVGVARLDGFIGAGRLVQPASGIVGAGRVEPISHLGGRERRRPLGRPADGAVRTRHDCSWI